MKPNPGTRRYPRKAERQLGVARAMFEAEAARWWREHAPRRPDGKRTTSNAVAIMQGLLDLFQANTGQVWGSYPAIAAASRLTPRQVEYGLNQMVAASPFVVRSEPRWTEPREVRDRNDKPVIVNGVAIRRRWRLAYFYTIRLPRWLQDLALGVVKAAARYRAQQRASLDKAQGRESLTAAQLIEKRRAERGDERGPPS